MSAQIVPLGIDLMRYGDPELVVEAKEREQPNVMSLLTFDE